MDYFPEFIELIGASWMDTLGVDHLPAKNTSRSKEKKICLNIDI